MPEAESGTVFAMRQVIDTVGGRNGDAHAAGGDHAMGKITAVAVTDEVESFLVSFARHNNVQDNEAAATDSVPSFQCLTIQPVVIPKMPAQQLERGGKF